MQQQQKSKPQKLALKGGGQSFLDLLKNKGVRSAGYTIHHRQRGGAPPPPSQPTSASPPGSHSGPITEATLLNMDPALGAIADPFAIYPSYVAPLHPSFQLGGAPPQKAAHKKPATKKKAAPAPKKKTP
jgi:hypothetical protein